MKSQTRTYKPSVKFYRMDGRDVVYMSISCRGDRLRTSTGVKCREDEFVDGWVHPKTEDGRLALQTIKDLKKRVDGIELHPMHDIKTVKKMLDGDYKHIEHNFTLMNAIYYGRTELDKSSALRTNETRDVVVRSFEDFLSDEYGFDDVVAEMIDISVAHSYRNWLIENGYHVVTVKKNLSLLSAMYQTYLTDHDGIINKFPINIFTYASRKLNRFMKQLPKQRRQNIYDSVLSDEQIEEIENFEFIGRRKHSLNRWRLVMLWQIYTGFSLSDLVEYNWKIKETKSGKFIELFRKKTGNRCSIPFTEECESVYNRLIENKMATHDYLFPMKKCDSEKDRLSEIRKYEYGVKKISEMLDIPCTSHLFRHTFGMRMSQRGVPLNHIATMMGHSSVTTTESFYVLPTDEDVIKSVRRSQERFELENQLENG